MEHEHVMSYSSAQREIGACESEQRTQSNMLRVETTSCKVPCFGFSPPSLRGREKDLPIMYQTRGTPTSRHTLRISPSGSKPQIGLSRAPTSGPSTLRSRVRASPKLRTLNRGTRNYSGKKERHTPKT